MLYFLLPNTVSGLEKKISIILKLDINIFSCQYLFEKFYYGYGTFCLFVLKTKHKTLS